MLVPRLGLAASNLFKISRPAACLFFQRGAKTKLGDNNDDDDMPIRYSQSRASQWKAEYNRVPQINRVWYTPYVVSGSVAFFLIYFCILREENDFDEIIYRPLPETLKGIEKIYPNYDFETKPDYVVYHEKAKLQKQKELLR